MMKHDDMINVLLAHAIGKEIEFRNLKWSDSQWCTTPVPNWNFYDYEYRVKKKQLEGWVNVYSDGHIQLLPTENDAKGVGQGATRIAVHMKEVI